MNNRSEADLYLHGRGSRVLSNTFERGCVRDFRDQNLVEANLREC